MSELKEVYNEKLWLDLYNAIAHGVAASSCGKEEIETATDNAYVIIDKQQAIVDAAVKRYEAYQKLLNSNGFESSVSAMRLHKIAMDEENQAVQAHKDK